MYKLFFVPVRGNQRSWLPAIWLSRAAAAPQASAPSSVDLDAAADQAISTGGGDARKTIKEPISANDFLALRFDELRAAVSKGYSRGRLPQSAKDTL
jgi:hypothetical protein